MKEITCDRCKRRIKLDEKAQRLNGIVSTELLVTLQPGDEMNGEQIGDLCRRCRMKLVHMIQKWMKRK